MKPDSTAVMALRHIADSGAPLLAHTGGGMSEQLVLVPSGAGSVMASRAPTAADDLDYFPTPPWAARAGGELISQMDPGGPWGCWEPAYGGGHMAHGLADYFAPMMVSDIHDHDGAGIEVVDFLSPGADRQADWIITNPPFVAGEAFIRTALTRARRGVAMLLRLQFKEGKGRYDLFHGAGTRIAASATFAGRVPMVKGRWDPEASSATAYCWFVWLTPLALASSPWRSAIEACWSIDSYVEKTIYPEAKGLLSRPADLERFCAMSPQGVLFHE